MRAWLSRVLGRVGHRAQVAAKAVRPPHPFAAEIAACRHRGVFVNGIARGCTFTDADGTVGAIPDGEMGPQCDALQDSDVPVAQDEHWLYLEDGRRLPLRRPVHGRLQ